MTERLAVDIGGTFVDAITFDRETRTIDLEKTATTPTDPATGVLNAIDAVGADLADTEAFVHGTTLGLNAILERKGAKTGIIANTGFEDIYEIGRTNLERHAMYDIRYEKPESLVPRRRRMGVPGRINANGEVAEPLDEAAVQEAADTLVADHGVESIAICFLHAYRNPDHEDRAADLVRERHDVPVSTSSAITREYREYERTSTATLDAYIKPIFATYIDRLEGELADADFSGSFFVTRSGGGTLTAERARVAPAHTVLSGPAGGLIGAATVGDATGREDLITLDIGGTSLDACVVEGGSPAVEYDADLEHQPLLLPVYDIRTIGAGGGSIAHLDGNLLKVGPQSAGADPGPICYGQGGTDPTVTDAAVALGYIDPEAFLGGEMELDADAAMEGLRATLADPLDTTVQEVSVGVFDVMVANTVGAIREITVEKGLDPREFSLVGYGGAGPMFAPLIARELDLNEVVVPQAPSVFSAWGMLTADVIDDFARTFITVLDEADPEVFESRFEELEAEAETTLTEEGFDPGRRRIERSVEMRYAGQEHTVAVPADDVDGLDALATRFEDQHESRYGHTMDDPVEAVHLRVRAIGENDKPELDRADPVEVPVEPIDSQEAYCFAAGERVAFDVYRRADLGADTAVAGPAIIREPTTTIVVHGGQRLAVDEYGHLIITEDDQDQ